MYFPGVPPDSTLTNTGLDGAIAIPMKGGRGAASAGQHMNCRNMNIAFVLPYWAERFGGPTYSNLVQSCQVDLTCYRILAYRDMLPIVILMT